MDPRPDRGLRRWRRPGWSPENLHQHRQARDSHLRLLRTAVRTFQPYSCTARASREMLLRTMIPTDIHQANEHNREHLEALPETSYPLA